MSWSDFVEQNSLLFLVIFAIAIPATMFGIAGLSAWLGAPSLVTVSVFLGVGFLIIGVCAWFYVREWRLGHPRVKAPSSR